MSLDQKQKDEIMHLVVLSLDGAAGREQLELLKQILISSSEAREYYLKAVTIGKSVREMNWDVNEGSDNDAFTSTDLWSALAEVEKSAISVEVEKPIVAPVYKFTEIKKSGPSKLSIYTAILSTAAMLLLLLYVWIVPAEPPIVASLGYTVDAVWGESTEEKVMGEELRTGAYYLEKGLAQIIFYDGAKAILEGPADFELSSTSAMELISGKVVANVNREAAGFTVKTPSGKVLDLGTEFGVDVDLTGNSDIHVFDGEVVLYPKNNGKKVPLLKGKAKRITTSGQQKNIELNKYAFVHQDEFNANVKALQGDNYYRWLAYSYRLRRDRSLVAYYTFEKDEQLPDVLGNKASLTEDMLDGDLYSAVDGELPNWTAGRWPQKTALNFDRSQRQVVIVPSDPALHVNGPITIAAWVKCDEPGDGGHIVSCRLSNQGVANYQLGYKAPGGWKGKIQFGRMDKLASEQGDRVHSRQKFDHSAEWKFITATHDNKEVIFYVDGRLIETHGFESFQETVIADLVIGADNVFSDSLRFTGDMGELAIFKRVLAAEEISEMYNAGKPE